VGVTETGTRAREPDESGFALSGDGLRLYWERHGAGSPSLVLMPPNPIGHSRIWKAQVHHLARHHRVIVYDGRGNGRADNPDPAATWLDRWRADDCLAVMDATGTRTAVLVGICGDGVWPSAQLAAAHPDRVLGIVALAPGVPLLSPPHPHRAAAAETFEDELSDPRGWEKFNRRFILSHQREFLEFFFGEMFPEPHSTKAVEDAAIYGCDAPAEMLVMDEELPPGGLEGIEAVCRQVRCPVLVVHGDRDNCQPPARGRRFAELTGAELVELTGAGHIAMVRHPVLINRLIHEFAGRFAPPAPPAAWTFARDRPRRALLVTSPIGLGHAWRDVAVARELRRLVPGLEVQWLAQPPVTRLLAECGESIHPASAQLAPEAAHVDAEAGEHSLHAFHALRRLDEIFCANFMVFHDVVAAERFDVWIADEGWEVDHFLHENPELKTAPYVWMTDFVGMLPMPEGGEREAFLVADHNAEMVDHVARHPRLRDRSIFFGEPEDIVADSLGPGLPAIRDWTVERFRFTGYVAPEPVDREALRAELGWAPDERVCVVSAGGSGVCTALLRRAAAAFPEAKARCPELRMIVVAGPRIDPATLPSGVEVHGYVHELHRQLAACDVAISHGGLSTTMELTAAGRPFLYFPLRGHFEQNRHVAHRLDRHGAGRRMGWEADGLAEALVEELQREPRYRPVPPGGATRAAEIIAELL
jgi:pimeloyl-ACP methyl ester carboxylesterase/predicted glycosyltransferase